VAGGGKTDQPRTFFYGWVIVGVALVSLAFWFGVRTSFSVFYVALLEDFGWKRAEAAGVQSLALITYTLTAPLVGGLIDRFGPRRVLTPGILVLAGGLILCSAITSLGQFYVYYGLLVGAGVTCVSLAAYPAILSHWFRRRLGLASGTAIAGTGLGTFAFVPLSQSFILSWGWRGSFLALAGLVLLLLLPLNALLLRHKPDELGLQPDGLEPPPVPAGRDKPAEGPQDWGLAAAMRTGSFWALMAFPCSVVTGMYIILVHYVPFLVDQGLDRMLASWTFAVAGLISSGFRIIWGWLSDRIGREKAFTLGMSCILAGLASLLQMGPGSGMGPVYVFVAIFGAGWGATAPLFVGAAADLFPGRRFGLIYGLLEGVLAVGGAFGAWVAGYIFDTTRSYRGAFVLAMAVTVLSVILMWLAAPRKRRRAGPGS